MSNQFHLSTSQVQNLSMELSYTSALEMKSSPGIKPQCTVKSRSIFEGTILNMELRGIILVALGATSEDTTIIILVLHQQLLQT